MIRQPPVGTMEMLAREVERVCELPKGCHGTLVSALVDAWSLGANGVQWRDIGKRFGSGERTDR